MKVSVKLFYSQNRHYHFCLNFNYSMNYVQKQRKCKIYQLCFRLRRLIHSSPLLFLHRLTDSMGLMVNFCFVQSEFLAIRFTMIHLTSFFTFGLRV